jgi:hypothetical protein
LDGRGIDNGIGRAAEDFVSDIEINPELVGRRVCNPLRPEWGDGTVLRVQAMSVDGRPAHRVSVQFATGHRALLIPPGRLAEPQPGLQREAGWLDRAAKQTVDDRLAALPESVREFLGTSAQRIVVLSRLYELDDDPAALLRWARSQTGAADPLSLWTRDEIRASFQEFCRRRDALLREAVTALRSTGGPTALTEALDDVAGEARDRILETLQHRRPADKDRWP